MQLEIDSSSVYYFSNLDEDHFFRWALEIPCVTSVDRGLISIETESVSEHELRELLALLTRYGLSIEPLRQLVNSSNEQWFNDPQKYWNTS